VYIPLSVSVSVDAHTCMSVKGSTGTRLLASCGSSARWEVAIWVAQKCGRCDTEGVRWVRVVGGDGLKSEWHPDQIPQENGLLACAVCGLRIDVHACAPIPPHTCMASR
jgi:hypothetical protein